MLRRIRRHVRLYWPYCHHGGWYWPHHTLPSPPWCMGTMTLEEEKEFLKEDIEMLKEELKASEDRIKELEESK